MNEWRDFIADVAKKDTCFLSELPFIWSKYSFLKGNFVVKKSLSISKHLQLKEQHRDTKLSERNPRSAGSWTDFYEYKNGSETTAKRKNAILFQETLACNSLQKKIDKQKVNMCAAVENATNKDFVNCSAQVKWIVYARTPDRITMLYQGTHGTAFSPNNPSKIDPRYIPKSTKDAIVNKSKQNLNPHQILNEIIAENASKKDESGLSLLQSSLIAPSITRVENIIRYAKSKDFKGKTTDEKVANLFLQPELKKFILWPKEEADFPQDDLSQEWVTVLAARENLEELAKAGQDLIMLDSVFKIIVSHDEDGKQHKRPLWNIVYVDNDHGWIGTIIVASHNRTHLLHKGLQVVKKKIEEITLATWQPIVMMDLDAVESGACSQLDWKVIYCQFHLQKLIRKHFKSLAKDADSQISLTELFTTIQRSTSDDEALERIAFMRTQIPLLTKPDATSELEKYLEDNYFNDKERSRWIDFGRPTRIGEYNTNNYSESKFKQIIYNYLHGKTHYPLYKAFHIIFVKIIPIELGKVILRRTRPNALSQRPTSTKIRLQKMRGNGYQLFSTNNCSLYDEFIPNLVNVKSASSETVYLVDINSKNPTCQCKYWFIHGGVCKHIYAAKFFLNQEVPKEIETLNAQEMESSDCEADEADEDLVTQDVPTINSPAQTHIGKPRNAVARSDFSSKRKAYKPTKRQLQQARLINGMDPAVLKEAQERSREIINIELNMELEGLCTEQETQPFDLDEDFSSQINGIVGSQPTNAETETRDTQEPQPAEPQPRLHRNRIRELLQNLRQVTQGEHLQEETPQKVDSITSTPLIIEDIELAEVQLSPRPFIGIAPTDTQSIVQQPECSNSESNEIPSTPMESQKRQSEDPVSPLVSKKKKRQKRVFHAMEDKPPSEFRKYEMLTNDTSVMQPRGTRSRTNNKVS